MQPQEIPLRQKIATLFLLLPQQQSYMKLVPGRCRADHLSEHRAEVRPVAGVHVDQLQFNLWVGGEVPKFEFHKICVLLHYFLEDVWLGALEGGGAPACGEDLKK